MNKLEITTRVKRLSNLLKDFEDGKILIPPFQRDYVWDNKKKIELLDSLNNGFPIGSVLFWMPDQLIRAKFYEEASQTIGSYFLEKNKAIEFYFILDGYQRLTTLFGCFMSPLKTKLKRDEKEWKSNFDIYYDLKNNTFEFNRKTKSSLEIYQVPLYTFFDGDGYFDLVHLFVSRTDFSNDEKRLFLDRYKQFASKINAYDIPVMELYGGTVKEAVNIFSRLNSRGELVSDDWKVSALSFDKDRNFRFGTKIDELFTNLEKYNFYTSKEERKRKREFILNCVLNSIDYEKAYFDIGNSAEALEQVASEPSFVDISLHAIAVIEKTIRFLYEHLLVLNNKFIASNNQIIFMLDFFKKVETPNEFQINELKKWFWVTSYSNYFTMYNLSDQREAYKAFQRFVNHQQNNPIYKKYDFNFKVKLFPNSKDFGSARYTSLALFMVNYTIRKENIMNSLPIDSRKIKGVNEYKLFKQEKSIGNTLFISAQDTPLNLRIEDHTDLSFLLTDEFRGQYEELFITDEMRHLYAAKRYKEVIQLREKLIYQKEKAFVESLGIEYEQ
jgi:Protein of unknown function DUF262